MCVIYVYIVSMTARRGREGKRRFPFPPKYCLMNNYNNLYDYSIPHKLKESCLSSIFLSVFLMSFFSTILYILFVDFNKSSSQKKKGTALSIFGK